MTLGLVWMFFVCMRVLFKLFFFIIEGNTLTTVNTSSQIFGDLQLRDEEGLGPQVFEGI